MLHLTDDDYDALYIVVKEEMPRITRDIFSKILEQQVARGVLQITVTDTEITLRMPDDPSLGEYRVERRRRLRELRRTKMQLTNHSNLNRLLVNALVATHPAPEVLARAIEQEKEKFLAHALPREKMSEQQIDFIVKNAARVVSALVARRQDLLTDAV